MIRRGRRGAQAVALLGFWVATGTDPGPGSRQSALAQATAPPAAEPAAGRVLARLRESCATKPELLGVFVRGAEPAGGALRLSGTLDRKAQAAALEAEAGRLLIGEPAWKSRLPAGVSAAGMAVLPVRSVILPKLRADFAASPADPDGRPGGLLRQTRLDDLFFDPAGRLKIVGLCVNHQAFLDSQGEGADPALDPRARVAQAVRECLKAYPMPEGVDPAALDRIRADGVEIKEEPARMLQSLIAGGVGPDDFVFLDSRFDAEGALLVEGLIGSPDQRPAAAALIGRPEIARAYARPGGAPPADASSSVAPMTVAPWRAALLAGVQARFARQINKGTHLEMLRYCRLDRARFAYREQGGLQLRFDGVTLVEEGTADTTQVVQSLRDEAARLFQPPQPVEYNVVNDLKPVLNPRRALHSSVAAEPALDGVRVDDVTVGPRGESTVEGIWLGERQAAGLDALLLPVLVARTAGKFNGPLAHRFRAVPGDQILRELRAKAAAAFDETSLDRLSYQFPDGTSPPAPTLTGSTPSARLREFSAALAGWLRADRRAEGLGPPAVKVSITGLPGSLFGELRTRVSREPTLDGIWIERAVFDEANVLTLSGRQGRPGMADLAVALVPAAAARVWPNQPIHVPARAGAFSTVPLGPMLDRLRRGLPYHREGDGVVLSRAYYRPDGALTFAGRGAGNRGESPGLETLVKSLIGVGPTQEVKLSLQVQPRDPERASRLLARGVDRLASNSVTNATIETLDEIVFLDPRDSTSWYLRAAYYQATGDRELAVRDLGRVKQLEASSPGLRGQRYSRITRFQGAARLALEELETSMPTAR